MKKKLYQLMVVSSFEDEGSSSQVAISYDKSIIEKLFETYEDTFERDIPEGSTHLEIQTIDLENIITEITPQITKKMEEYF